MGHGPNLYGKFRSNRDFATMSTLSIEVTFNQMEACKRDCFHAVLSLASSRSFRYFAYNSMGGCVSSSSPEYPGAVTSEENVLTNRQLHRMARDASSRKILLLLGTGESGKSTFFRQLKLVALKVSTFLWRLKSA